MTFILCLFIPTIKAEELTFNDSQANFESENFITPYKIEINNPVNKTFDEPQTHLNITYRAGVNVFGSYVSSNTGGGWHIKSRNLYVQPVNKGPYKVVIISTNWINGTTSGTVAGTYRVRLIYVTTNIVVGV